MNVWSIARVFVTTSLIGLVGVSEVFAFGPCQENIPSSVSFLPSVERCGGNAAVVLSGRFKNSFSVVVRDCRNGDRDPCSNHGDSPSCGTAQSSPYKVQKVINARVIKERTGATVSATVHCLKEPGTSKVYELVRRITIKLRDPVRSSADVVKYCLHTRVKPVNNVTIDKVFSAKRSSGFGYTPICDTQKYLACDYSYAAYCPKYD